MASASPPFDSTLTTIVAGRQLPALEAVQGQQADEAVTVDDLAPFVDRHAAVRVAVEGEADVGAAGAHPGRQGDRVRWPRSRR